MDALLALAVFAAAPLYPAPVRDSYPVPSPDGTQVVFQSNRDGTAGLWRMQVDGQGLLPLEAGADEPSTPDYSPDGKRLVFAARVGAALPGATSGLFVMGLSSGITMRVEVPAATDIGHPKWTPDGRIVFDSNAATPDPSLPWLQQWQDVYSVRPDGSDLRRHTRCRTICSYAQFSPDGRRLVYRKVAAEPGRNWALDEVPWNSEVVIADADGRNERNLTRHPAFDGWPSWSPDGHAIVFASARLDRPRAAGLFVVDVESGAVRRIGDPQRSYAQPRFAPDGRSVWAYDASEFTDAEGNAVETGTIVRVPVDRGSSTGSP